MLVGESLDYHLIFTQRVSPTEVGNLLLSLKSFLASLLFFFFFPLKVHTKAHILRVNVSRVH